MLEGILSGDPAVDDSEIARRRKLAETLLQQGLSTEPIRHWSQGAARLVQGLSGAMERERLDQAEKANRAYGNQMLAAILGGGATPAAVPSPNTPAAPPNTATPAAAPAPVPQQPLLPNRPQMPAPNIFDDVVKAMPQQTAEAPSPFGVLNSPVSPGSPAPLWTQPGLTKGLPAIGQMPASPSLAFNAPGPMVPMGGNQALAAAVAGGATPDATFGRMLTQESGNRQFNRDGTPVTSPKGATGIAQVMPATGPEAARLAGVVWDENRFRNDPDYNRTLGRAYYDAQVKRYGDPVTAAAAYNAGPGNVDKAIRRQEQTGQPFTDFLPAETQNYIAKVGGPDAPAEGAQTAQFNVPGQPPAAAAPLANDRQQAIARFLLDPRVPQSMKQSVMPVLTNMMNQQTQNVDLGDKIAIMRNGQVVGYLPKSRDATDEALKRAQLEKAQRENNDPRPIELTGPDGEKYSAVFDPATRSYKLPQVEGRNNTPQPVNIPGVGAVSPPTDKKAREAFFKEVGEQQAKAALNAPQAIENATNALSVIDQLDQHKGLPGIVGKMGVFPNMPGGQAADAENLLAQIKGKTFLQAFESLKGGGAITEVEGQKATEAIGRLGKTQSEKAFRQSLGELRGIIQRGMERARATGQQPQTPQAQSQGYKAPKAAPSPIMDEARAAIARGADPEKVKARLRERGYEPEGF